MKLVLAALVALLPAVATAEPKPFPPAFTASEVAVGDATLHLRVGGQGPAVLLLHGFGDTGDMWQPLAERLAADHTVIVPDLAGMGLSSHSDRDFSKRAQAKDLLAVLDGLGVGEVALVTHDIGNMVGFALAAQARDRVRAWVAMDAPLPGLGRWNDLFRDPRTWHFNFRGPDVERLVAGRERILLDRFYNDLSADPAGIDEATRTHYAALYARPGAMHDAFEQDAVDNQAFVATGGKLAMPVLAIGGAASFGAAFADEISAGAEDVSGVVIENTGDWLMEEQPEATVDAIAAFLARHD